MSQISDSANSELYDLCVQVEQSNLNEQLVKLCVEAELNYMKLLTNQVVGGAIKRSSSNNLNSRSDSKRTRPEEPSTSSSSTNQVGGGNKRPAPNAPDTTADGKRTRPGVSQDERSNTQNSNGEHPSTSTDGQAASSPPQQDPTKVKCLSCNIFVNKRYLKNHYNSNSHKNRILFAHKLYENVTTIDTAFGQRLVTYRITSPDNVGFETPETFMQRNKIVFQSLIDDSIKEHTAVKVNFILHASFTQETKNIENEFDFQTFNNVFCLGDDFDITFSSVLGEICSKLQRFEKKDSGWSLKRINHIDVNINKFNPLRGSSYIKLPFDIQKKHAVINVQNNDDKCFKWAVLSALYPVCNNTNRVSSYARHEDRLKFNDISFPMKLKDIGKFEKLNDNISINVFGLEYDSGSRKNQVVGPLYFTKSRKENHINLLYLVEGNNGHYCYIKNLSRLVSTQINSHKDQKHLCDGCLLYFPSIERLQNHNQNDCAHIRTNLPDSSIKKDRFGNECPYNILKFQNYHKKMEVPFVIYADFEAFLTPLSDNEPTAKTCKVQRHDVHSFAYYLKCSFDDSLSHFKTYRGDDCGKKFMESLRADVSQLADHLTKNIPMNDLTAEEKRAFDNATHCHICNRLLNGDSVRDHCHLTGSFVGPAHNNCNLNYKVPLHVPIFLHNLSNYDAHFIVHELKSTDGDIDLIPINKEKYISFTEKMRVGERVISLRFLDSLRFMSASLDSLSRNLGADDFTQLRKEYPNDEDFKLLIRKGVYPYEYIKSHTDLEETITLPEPEHFYNHLNDSTVSDDDYKHAKTVWDHFKCRNMGDYSDLYLKTDVLLLTDVFENFRKVCMKTYDLDPAQYYTAPGLSWEAMLKCTQIELELLTDYDMLAFIKSGIRGGVSQCSNRHARANNKFMDDYDITKPSSYLMYLDANNLYGWAMSQYLPVGNFKWIHPDSDFDFNIADTSTTGYILEVDLEYPDNLHDSHSDFPLCPQNICVGNSNDSKLVTTLNDKEKYVIHYRNLKQCLKLGMKLKKVHRVLQFDQSPWLQKYIDLNTKLRTSAKTNFEKDFYKLMNNSVFGKTMENINKRVDVKLVTHWSNIGKRQGAESLISRPNFHSLAIFSENFVAIQLHKTKVYYDKPIYLGFCILDISKTLMYDFHYNFMKNKYQNNIKMLYTDTDSLVYQIYTENFYEDIKPELTQFFDTSDYPPSNVYGYPNVNKKKIGLFKDENNGRIFKEFVGLRAKMYAMDVDKNFISKAKGVNKCVTKQLKMENYKRVLEQKENEVCQMYRFRSIKHLVYTEKISKISLSHDDTKRVLIPNSTDTLAWGHYKLREH